MRLEMAYVYKWHSAAETHVVHWLQLLLWKTRYFTEAKSLTAKETSHILPHQE